MGTGEHFSANLQGSVTADTVTGGVPWAYGYNGPQRLGQVSMNGVVQASYAYDGVGRRASKTIGSTVTNHVYGMSGNLLAEHDVNGHMLTENIWLGGTKLAEVDAAGNLYSVHGDRLGTPQRLTNAGAGLAWDASYQPYGAATIAAGSGLPQAQRLPGQYDDTESGLHQNGARDYSPVVGRYLESDPIGLAGGMNTYAYAAGNPVRWTDFLGLQPQLQRNPPGSPAYNASQNEDPQDGEFLVAGHGDPYSMSDQRDGTPGQELTASDLADLIKNSDWKPGQKIRLNSCNTGVKFKNGFKDVAELLSKVLGTEVTAPDNWAWVSDDGKVTIAPASDPKITWDNWQGIDEARPDPVIRGNWNT